MTSTLAEKLVLLYKTSRPLEFAETSGVAAIAWSNKILRQLDGAGAFPENTPLVYTEFEFAQLDAPDLYFLKALLESHYTDSITAIRDVTLDDDDNLTGIFEDKVSPNLIKRFRFTISDRSIASDLLNPDEVDNFAEESLEFKAAAKKRNCVKGRACGNSCISSGRTCRTDLNEKATKAKNKVKQKVKDSATLNDFDDFDKAVYGTPEKKAKVLGKIKEQQEEKTRKEQEQKATETKKEAQKKFTPEEISALKDEGKNFYSEIDAKAKKLKPKKQKITIAAIGGEKEVEADVYNGQLAIHRSAKSTENKYVITHVPSGMQVTAIKNKTNATRITYRLLNEVDLSAKDLPPALLGQIGSIVSETVQGLPPGTDLLKVLNSNYLEAPEFAEEELNKDPADLYTEQAIAAAAPIFEDWLSTLESSLFDGAESLEVVRDRLEEAYPQLEATQFAELMHNLMLAGYGAGRYQVQQETAEDEDDNEANFAESTPIKEPELLAAIRRILAKYYTDGIDAIANAVVDEEDNIKGVFLDYINSRLTKRFAFIITDSDISYRLINPDQVEQADFSEPDILDFATPKQCKKGIACGNSCISAGKTCKKQTTPAQSQAKQAIVKQVKEVEPKPTKVEPETKKPASNNKKPKTGLSEFPDNLDDLKTVKSLGGSTGAKLVKDPATGKQYVMKKGSSPDHIKEESTADRLYEAMGVNVPKHKLYETSDGPIKLAEYIEGKQLGQLSVVGKANAMATLRENFAVDALLANWDVVGMSEDNVIVGKDKKVYRIDNGGSLRYRAQGNKSGKNFDAAPIELFTMRDHKVNGYSASVFGSLTYKEAMAQVSALQANKTKILSSITDPELKGIVTNRLKTLDWLAKNESALTGSGASETEIEAFHKQFVQDLKSGIITKLPTQKQAIAQFESRADLQKKALGLVPGIETKFDKLTDAEVKKQYKKVEKWLDDKAEYWEEQLQDPVWQIANNAPPPPPPGSKELAAVQEYTGGTYKSINRYLRGQNYKSPLGADDIKAISHLGSSALIQLPSYGETVYRGTDLTPDILAKYEIGKSVTEPAFSSTTKTQSKAFPGNTHYVIHPKKQESKSADIELFSHFGDEAEVLYPPGTQFKVLEKSVGKPQTYGGTTYENLLILQEI